MKKLIAMIIALGILFTGTITFAAEGDVKCPCGCEQKAIICKCPSAKKALRGA